MVEITLVEITFFVVLVLHQPKDSGCTETTTSHIDIPVEATDCNLQPVLETRNLSQLIPQSLDL